MPPFEVGSTRAIGAVHADIARKASTTTASIATAAASTAPATGTAGANATIVTSTALERSEAPVDGDRVSEIRKAVESGTYPLVPAKIADALIAAGILLRTGKA